MALTRTTRKGGRPDCILRPGDCAVAVGGAQAIGAWAGQVKEEGSKHEARKQELFGWNVL
jgi:hypothetical protein